MTAGHNSVEAGPLKSFVERIEHIESEISDLNDTKKDLYSEIRSSGYDVPVLRKVVAKRAKLAKDREKVETADEIFELYMRAIEGAS